MRHGTMVSLALCVSFACATIASAADFTGTWSGTLSAPNTCDNRPAGTLHFATTAFFTQSGEAVFGSLLLVSDKECDGLSHTYVASLGGSLSGATLTARVTLEGLSGQFTATLAGDSIAARLFLAAEEPLDATGTLTRTSSQPPASDFSGTYDGTYNAIIIPCRKLAPVSYSGGMSGSLVQAGTTLAGPITITGDKQDKLDSAGNCTLIDRPPERYLFAFLLNGNTLTGVATDPSGRPTPTITGAINGNTITGFAEEVDFPGESFTFTLTRTSSGTPAAISTFTARPNAINLGEPSTLSWTTIGATSVSIDNRIGTVPVSGAITVSPQQTTTYTLSASGPGGSATATTTITVNGGGPRLTGTRPAGMLAEVGETASDSFNVTNVGSASANVRLSTNDNFFTAAPVSFTLRAGETQVISIQASAQPAGKYDGTINVSGDGLPAGGVDVRVRLLVAAPPTAPVNPRADSSRVEVSGPAGQNPSGSVSFTNSGAATVRGIAVADVPWILPQTDPVTIAPGQSQQVTFTIDRSKRPDGDTPLGGAAGTISLVYFAFGASKGVVNATPTSHTSRVSVSVLDLSKPNVASDTPPALGTGEVAFFLNNLPSVAGVSAGDLFLSNTGDTAMSDVKVFHLPSIKAAALPQLPPNLAVLFPSISRTVFGVDAAFSLQVRTPNPENMSVGNLSTLIKSGYAYSSSVPVFRSDRGAASGEQLVLAGIEQSTANSSVVFLQELKGTQATAQVQFLDSSGATLGSPQSQTIAPFGAVTVTDTPASARAAVITNTSSAAASISAFARVANAGSNDGWMVVDSAKAAQSSSDTLIVPVLPISGSATATVNLFATNTSANSVTVSMDQVSAAVVKRRAVGASPAQPRPESTSTVGPMETASITINGLNAGFVRLSAPLGSVHVNGRITAAVLQGSGAMGSGLPAIPLTAAMGTGQSKRFTGVDDSQGSTTATFRSSLMLIDPSDSGVLVRVTLRFTYSAGTSTSAEATAARDFSLSGGQAMFISNLARAMIGSQRDALGDLRNMQVDITVIDGGGSVIPVIEAVDNASGDIVVRTE